MSMSQTNNLLKLRFDTVADSMLQELQRFLTDADGERNNFVIVLKEDDARVGFDCLSRLGLQEDAKQLAKSFNRLELWTHLRVLDCFGEIAGDSSEKLQQFREFFGPVPSSEELQNLKNERLLRDENAIELARRLKTRLENTRMIINSPAPLPPTTDAAAATESHKSPQQLPVPKVAEQMTLRARIAAFLLDASQRTGKIPTFQDVSRVFAGEIEPRSTFYRNNPWFTTYRKGLSDSLTRDPPPTALHNVTGRGDSFSIDAQVEAPDYFDGDGE